MSDDPQSSGSHHGGAQAEENQSSGTHENPSNALHLAAEIGDLQQVRQVLDSCLGDEDRHRLLTSRCKNDDKFPLHRAAHGGHNDILALLLPPKLPLLTSATPSKKDGWSSMHFAAAYGHAHTVEWLFAERNAAPANEQDRKGNTPLHFAVVHGHKDVVRHLVRNRANLFIHNHDRMMPISFCRDSSMFEAFFSTDTEGRAGLNRASLDAQSVSTVDAEGRTILHYAAQFATDPNAVAILIAEMHTAGGLDLRDNEADSFLHVAAKSGNMHILQALKMLSIGVEDLMEKRVSDSTPPESPAGMYALLHDHRDFFNELITMSTSVKVLLSSIIKTLLAELIVDPKIQGRLALFASTLPTYLALYANKNCIFNFMLETNVISINQCDDEYKRTCLHWAVIDERPDIVNELCLNLHMSPGSQDKDGKTALQHAVERTNHNMVMDIQRARPDLKDYEDKLYRDRDVYGQALNAILVGAALIASVAFAGWLQWPSTANWKSLKMKIFWTSNSISFFTAVATMCVTIAALIPTPNLYVGVIVKKLRLAIVVDAGLLALSLAAVMCAFATVGFAAIQSSHVFTYERIMRVTTASAGFISFIMWLSFVSLVYKSAPHRSEFLDVMLPDRIRPRLSGRRLSYHKSNLPKRFQLSRKELVSRIDDDLVLRIDDDLPSPMDPVFFTLVLLLDISKMLNNGDAFIADIFGHIRRREEREERKIIKEQMFSRLSGFGRTSNVT